MNAMDENARRPFRSAAPAAGVLILAALTAALCLWTCNGDSEQDGTETSEAPPVAQVSIPDVTVLLRRPGEMAFERTSERLLAAGSTVKTEAEWMALNVAGAVQLQIHPWTEVVLAGSGKADGEDILVIGLQKGEVRLSAVSYILPVHLETPAGLVAGKQAHYTARISEGEDGAFRLEVQALTKGLVLSNPHGSIDIPITRRGFAEEGTPPRILPGTAVPGTAVPRTTAPSVPGR